MGARGAGLVVGALAAALGHTGVAGARPAGWQRTNYRGRRVSLRGGVATGAALVAVGAQLAAIDPGLGCAQACAAASAATLGYIDDTRGQNQRAKGLAGHLGALAHGRVTTGAAKIAGIGAGAAVAAAILGLRRHSLRAADWAVDAALIAGTANLANLLDLRPGRLLKAAALADLPLVALAPARVRVAAAALLTVTTAELPADLDERHMLGDVGANPVGATLGVLAVAALPRYLRRACLAGVVALTLASERVSFSRVIESTPALRAIDGWGRRA